MIRSLIAANLHVVLVIAAILITTYVIFDFPVDWFYVGLVLSATSFLYPTHRLVSLMLVPEAQYPNRLVLASQLKSVLYAAALAGMLGTLWFALHIQSVYYVGIAFAGALGLGYSIPIYKKSGAFRRLRDVPGIKSFIVGLSVALFTAYLPGLPFRTESDTGLILWFLAEWLFVSAVTLPFDVRDLSGDRVAGTRTLPLLIGTKQTYSLASLLLVGYEFLVFLNYWFTDSISGPVFVALLFSGFMGSYLLNRSSKEHMPEWLYTLRFEGLFLVKCAAVLLASML